METNNQTQVKTVEIVKDNLQEQIEQNATEKVERVKIFKES